LFFNAAEKTEKGRETEREGERWREREKDSAKLVAVAKTSSLTAKTQCNIPL